MIQHPFNALWVAALLAGAAWAAPPSGQDEFGKAATWGDPTPAEVRSLVQQWLKDRQPDAELDAKVIALWPADGAAISGIDALQRVADSIALVDANAKQLVALCTQPRTQVALPKVEWLADDKTQPFVRNNLRLLYGRWLVQQLLYDEALEQLAGLNPGDVVDPASLLFYQSVVHQRLLNKDPGLAAVGRLLERDADIPRRYEAVARLVYEDLNSLKDDSLDHVARRMDDIRRRLDHGHAGPRIRKVEDGVIATLDKMIEDLEKQQSSGGGGGGSPQGIQSSGPAADSNPASGKGEGEVDRKAIGHKSGWGDLPPKQRQEAMQQIGKDFPSHYREVVEEYFRRMASDSGDKDK